MYALMDDHLTCYKCCPHWDDVQWPWPGSIPQRSSSHKTFKGQSTHACVCAITYICMDGLPSNLLQMLSSLRWCAVTLTQIHTSNVKVTQDQTTCIPYFPIGSVQFWSGSTYQWGWEKNNVLKKR